MIASGISEDSVTNRYIWDTSSVPEGNYYILGEITDGKETVRDYTTKPVRIQNGTSDEDIKKGKAYSYWRWDNIRWVAIGDINNDGREDVVVRCEYDGSYYIGLFLQQADGDLSRDSYYKLDSYSDGIAIGDIDNEGKVGV